ncbi:ankyrin repeat protein [Oesophagostomum dentatum]|uniref:Acyl-CoA-binding domain-containing protein 6 n=1 Tax=Oesophagostomum dentatum TaxID=61180 RepID=A0A0B1SIZ1_OESDE|nr:ankyrin repeat protein [Oesophagostomum dentatum]
MFTVLLARYYQKCFEGPEQQETKKEISLEEEFGLMDNPDEAQIDPELRARFLSASSHLPSIVGRLDRNHLTQFYALYKQATVGPAKASDKPSFFDAKGRIKYEAWAQLGDMPKDVAMKTYVAKMAYMNLGWDPTAQRSSQGFGIRPSRPAVVSESSDGSSASVSDREALLWFTAAKADDVATITDIYTRRPELLNQTDQHLGMTALHWAIDSGCDKVVHFLISKGTDVNAVDPEGNTPLHFGE